MQIINGKFNSAKVYASIIEDEALEQIKTLCDQEWTRNLNIAIMPDSHAGAGCTIGTSMILNGKVAPQLVGVDIGCGMLAMCVGDGPVDLQKLDMIIHSIPSGRNVWSAPQFETHNLNLCMPSTSAQIDYWNRSLGTLGGGNHFIELDVDSANKYWLVIHTGSRHLGVEVCNYYQEKADETRLFNMTYAEASQKLIREYKSAGHESMISQALINLKDEYNNVEETNSIHYIEDLIYKYYINDMIEAQMWATDNRKCIADFICEKMGWKPEFRFETRHNYIETNIDGLTILRKGAVAAYKGQKLLIPMNMRDGSLLCIGKGNEDWNYTAPHGAGRLMSRAQARKTLNIEEFKSQMEEIYTTTATLRTIDEAPMAYKPWEIIKQDIEPTVEVIDHWRPIYNFKAEE